MAQWISNDSEVRATAVHFGTFGLNSAEALDPEFGLDLHTAASVGDIEQVVRVTDLRDRLTQGNRHGWTPLMYAAYYDHAALIQFMVDTADPVALLSSVNEDGRSALALAAVCGHERSLKLLLRLTLQAGLVHADLERPDGRGLNPLFHAVRMGHHGSTQLLLECGCDPNRRIEDTQGYSVLMMAIKEGHDRVAEVLIHHGADVNFTNIQNESPKSVAVKYGRDRLLAFLLRSSRAQAPSALAGPALVEQKWANLRLSASSSPSLSSFLIEAGVDLKYLPRLNERNIDLPRLLTMSERDLKGVIELMGPRKKLSAAVIRARQSSQFVHPT
ncbi:ankyrin repeat and SAM domain-containing protein 3-like [Tigriopus californicus]|uniref:ankyrin repeat and SAM domain-containing protein 3-like n=1 Tax=Tigriopus californicus TaxID=6832 RepID=UPI0027DA072F|nr:ankyrin repeat and SAM domain-containing protein 3-like [Tigriopus californicus]